MTPIGEKMKEMGREIKETFTPGHKKETGTGYTTRGAETEQGQRGATAYETGKTGSGLYGTEGADVTGGGTAYGTEAAGTRAAGTEGYGAAGTTPWAEGAGAGESYGKYGTASGEEQVVGRDYITATEDRPQVRERTEKIREHRPVEKEYVVETRPTGTERELHGQGHAEHLGTQERIIEGNQPGYAGAREDTD